MMGTRQQVHEHGPDCHHHEHRPLKNENIQPLTPQQQLHQNQTVGSLRARFKKLSKDLELATEQTLHLRHQLSSSKKDLKDSERRNGILNALVQSLRQQQQQLQLHEQNASHQGPASSPTDSNPFVSSESQRIKELEAEVERLKQQRDEDRKARHNLELEVFEAMEFVENGLASMVLCIPWLKKRIHSINMSFSL